MEFTQSSQSWSHQNRRSRKLTFWNCYQAWTHRQDHNSESECSKLEQKVQKIYKLTQEQTGSRLNKLLCDRRQSNNKKLSQTLKAKSILRKKHIQALPSRWAWPFKIAFIAILDNLHWGLIQRMRWYVYQWNIFHFVINLNHFLKEFHKWYDLI